jgi:hypothetical protein
MKKIYHLGLLIFVATAISCSSTTSKDNTQAGATSTTSGNKASSASMESIVDTLTCTFKNDNRTITHHKNEDGGCTVKYSKFGESKEVATAKFDRSHCDEIFNRIKSNLIENSFVCK